VFKTIFKQCQMFWKTDLPLLVSPSACGFYSSFHCAVGHHQKGFLIIKPEWLAGIKLEKSSNKGFRWEYLYIYYHYLRVIFIESHSQLEPIPLCRVIIKEGHKEKRYYTAKICIFEPEKMFLQTKNSEHLIIYFKLLQYFT